MKNTKHETIVFFVLCNALCPCFDRLFFVYPPSPHRHPLLRLALIAGIFVVLVTLVVGGALVVSVSAASDTILPGVSVGGVPVGGLTREQASVVLKQRQDELLNRGLAFSAGGKSALLLSGTVAPEDPDLNQERVVFDRDRMVRDAFVVGHDGNVVSRAYALVRARVRGGVDLPLRFTLDEKALAADLHRAFAELEKPVREPSFSVTNENGVFRFAPIPGVAGITLDAEKAVAAFRRALAVGGQIAPIHVKLSETQPRARDADADHLAPEAGRVVQSLTATTTIVSGDRSWNVTRAAIAGWLGIAAEVRGDVRIAFLPERLEPFMNEIAAAVEVAPRDAKFKLEGKRVVEFVASREGVALNREATRAALEAAWIRGSGGPVEAVLDRAAPKVAVGDVNTLGIKEVLGVGTSNFSGSPKNRIKNIRNGITKLNGTLIEPGEEFSLLRALRPFTPEGGYLPELVIKGDKIEPELGGGLCQIGTTSFRMAMNSGMKITARQNHSLVVRYYNDPKNKNPGTDATIYDPWPDFKFINDTGRYLLIATEMNTATGNLAFTLWGTSDGRRGTYAAPALLKWYPAGPDKEIPTTDLKPGERKCQEKHPGADASFVYTRILPDGTEEKKTYTSHYRSLPKICLVGVTPDQMPVTPGSSSSPDPDAAASPDAGAPAT